jgi:hypothetical protein
MVTGKSQPGTEPIHPLPPSANHAGIATSPPSKRDLASWWRQFKRNTRKEDVKGTFLERKIPCLLGALVSELPGMCDLGCERALLAYATPFLQFNKLDR